MTVILASGNSHKIEELELLFKSNGLDVSFVPMTSIVPDIVIEETGETFEENAYIKAITLHHLTGMPVLADDSGLEIDVLNGAPGVRSARFSGEGATDETNRAAVREELQRLGVASSAGRFRCVLCFVDSYRTLFGVGMSHGTITSDERGGNGFGYDSMFTPSGMERRYAELTQEEKSSISHRGAAVVELTEHLRAIELDRGYSVDVDPLLIHDALVMASVSAVMNDTQTLRSTIRHFVRSEGDAIMLHEALLQAYLFAGFPVALEALAIADEECRLLLGSITWPQAEPYDESLFRVRGEELCRRIYGNVFEKMMSRLGHITPELSSWMIVEGYGKTLSRSNLPITLRELCIVGILAALERENQLKSHIRGALRVGVTLDELAACADVVTELCGKRRGSHILRIVLLQEAVVFDD